MRRLTVLVLICQMFFVSYLVASTNTQVNASSKQVTLDDVIQVIDKYLSQNAVNVEKLAAEREFQLKVLALRVTDKFWTSEIVDILEEFENLLGDCQFVYEGTIFKKSTIYLYRAQTLARASDANLMFDRIVEFVLTKCANKKEQWEILGALFGSYGIDEVEPEKVKNLDQGLKLYFVLSEYFYKTDKKFFYSSAFSTYTTLWTSRTAVGEILGPIVNLAKYLGEKLTKEQKDLILRESMKYVELEKSYPDEIVKIYYYLNK